MTINRRPGRVTVWPHGQPTIVCGACHGSGIDNAGVWAHLQGRAVLTDAERDRTIKCPTCDGRGRITIAHALATGQRIDP